MKCNNCGYECGEDFAFCTNCSAQSAAVAEPIANPVGEKVMAALKDKLFLVLCILITASAFLSLTSGGGLPVFHILFTVFLWIAFAKSRKNIVDTNQLKNLSGTVYAYYIVMSVSTSIVVVCGAVSIILLAISGGFGMLDSLLSQYNLFGSGLLSKLIFTSGWLMLVVITIYSVAMLIVTVIGWRKIHRFAKSVYQSIESYSQNVVCATAAKNWVLVFGIVNTVTSLSGSNGGVIISNLCYTAAAVLAYMLINKYLTGKQ